MEEVREVLAKRTVSKRTEYLILWEGYGPEDDTWELEEVLISAREVVRDFEAQG
jgi:hypothetical protein